VPKVDVAVTTWNRRDSVGRAIESALAQDVDGMRVVVYDNGSTDGTPELCRERFGEQIVYRRWEENRGRHANMTRAFAESEADHLIMLFDDEELLPGAIGAMLGRAADDPTAAIVAGRFLYRDADGKTMRESSLQAPVDFRPPARLTGDDFIRMAYRSGDWTWVCSVLFNRAVVGATVVLERDTPCDDAGLLLRSAMRGPILYVDRATTTKTDGNLGESIRDGLTEAETLEARNVIRLSGILGFRHTLEKFLFFEAYDHFTTKERRAMLRDLDNFAASLLGDRLADVRKVSDETKVRHELRESLNLVHGLRARARLIRRSVRQGRPR
jgi:glycosyltransferase involved in cell wall biosynthesis